MLPAGTAPEMADKALAAWPAVAARASGVYTGFLGPSTDADVAAASPAPTYRRLAGVKQRYDPGNVFRRNHNIRPAGADIASASHPLSCPQAAEWTVVLVSCLPSAASAGSLASWEARV